MQNGLNTDNSDFGDSDESLPAPDSEKATWLGPKTQNSKVVSSLPVLSF